MASTSDLAIEDKRLLARVEDAIRLCDKRAVTRFVGFLDERQAAVVRNYVKREHPYTTWSFDGGHEQAERVMLGIFPDAWEAEQTVFPFAALAVRFREQASLTHRDILGSVLGCGVERDRIGDILIESGLAVVFVHEDIAPFLCDSLTKVGREGVTATYPYSGHKPCLHRFSPLDGTVASPRLDAVLKVLLGVSREQAAVLIQTDRVRLNHADVGSVSATVHEGNIVSVSGYGRYVIDDLSERSKKGRVILRARKYV